MKKLIRFATAVLALTAIPGLAMAASPWTEKTTYGDKVLGKLEFGIKNVLGGWTEIVTEPRQHHKDGKNIVVGMAKGLGNAAIYTVGGALHLATFPIPQIDLPLPENGVNF